MAQAAAPKPAVPLDPLFQSGPSGGVTGMVQAKAPPLVLVQADAEWVKARRSGRYDVDREVWESPRHLEKALMIAQERLIYGRQALFGERYVDEGFDLQGPLAHIDFLGSAHIDPGPVQAPAPPPSGEIGGVFQAVLDRHYQAERALSARRMQRNAADVDLVDFRILASFWAKATPVMRIAGKTTIVGGVSPKLAGSSRLVTAKR